MATLEKDTEEVLDQDAPLRLRRFYVDGLFGSLRHEFEFPESSEGRAEPTILILSGENGTGKTTILSMINGMLRLEFDVFRQVPFKVAELELSDGKKLKVSRRDDQVLPLEVSFDRQVALLTRDRFNPEYNPEQDVRREEFREKSIKILRRINYELLGIDRSFSRKPEPEEEVITMDPQGRMIRRPSQPTRMLATRVQKFLRDAQLNHRRFFESTELDLLPQILKRLGSTSDPSSRQQLLQRVNAISEDIPVMRRFGLQTDESDLRSLMTVLDEHQNPSEQYLAVIQTYVEIQERKNAARDLIVKRLIQFEEIMDDFMFEKSVRIDARRGLKIESRSGVLAEEALSSGEFHFLYMMVAALLCERSGSIIAIDEPELSLHVRWQRKLLTALARCASGASPLFFLATHSTAIAAEHVDKVHQISSID